CGRPATARSRTPTTWWRRSSRRWRAPCGRRWRRIRGPPAWCPAPRAPCEEGGEPVKSLLPLLLYALAGVLVGGAVSLYRQGAKRIAVAVPAVLAVLALAAGTAWLWPT